MGGCHAVGRRRRGRTSPRRVRVPAAMPAYLCEISLALAHARPLMWPVPRDFATALRALVHVVVIAEDARVLGGVAL